MSAGTLEASELTAVVPGEGYLLGTNNDFIKPVEEELGTVGVTCVAVGVAEELVRPNIEGVLFTSAADDFPPTPLSFFSPPDP